MRRYIIFFIFFCFAFHSYTQEKFLFGFSSTLQNTNVFEIHQMSLFSKLTLRPAGNFLVEYRFSEKNRIQSGLGYSWYTQNNDIFKNNFHYLSLPLYYKRLSSKNKFSFVRIYGININWLLNAKHIPAQGQSSDITNYCRNYHFDILCGAGIRTRLNENYLFEALFIGSFGNAIKKETTVDSYFHNFNIGLKFNLLFDFIKNRENK